MATTLGELLGVLCLVLVLILILILIFDVGCGGGVGVGGSGRQVCPVQQHTGVPIDAGDGCRRVK